MPNIDTSSPLPYDDQEAVTTPTVKLHARRHGKTAEQASYAWIVAYDASHPFDPYALKCLRCGEMHRVQVPISIADYCEIADGFRQVHKFCKAEPDATGTTGEGAAHE